jgi:nucleoside 2-deoxyribosyltransferase
MFQYDIFLSHAAQDGEEADKVRAILIDAGFRVYCDRHDDPMMKHDEVDEATANTLRERMRRCNAMVYVVTHNAPDSKWMPWELGFFDGVRGKVSVYPVDEAAAAAAKSQEYLKLFKNLTPGSLSEQLKSELRTPNELLRELREAPMFGGADAALTGVYRERLAEVHPFDFARVAQVQNEIWRAWLRLWGIGR